MTVSGNPEVAESCIPRISNSPKSRIRNSRKPYHALLEFEPRCTNETSKQSAESATELRITESGGAYEMRNAEVMPEYGPRIFRTAWASFRLPPFLWIRLSPYPSPLSGPKHAEQSALRYISCRHRWREPNTDRQCGPFSCWCDSLTTKCHFGVLIPRAEPISCLQI